MQTDKTFRVRILQKSGALARLINAMSETGVMFNNIETRYAGRQYLYRDITVEVDSEIQYEKILTAVERIDGVYLDEVVDEVLHLHEGGKMIHRGKWAVDSLARLRELYTPGVAKVCVAIHANPLLAKQYTNAGNTVAVISNGSRVLGLGDLGPRAVLPVLESKALFYGQFVDLNAVPIALDVKGVDEFVEVVVKISPTFAGIHLEDICSPQCFAIEEQLMERLDIPVMHDDQHGTAVAALAAITNMLRFASHELKNMTVAQIGLGAAGLAIARLIKAAGAKSVIGFDPNAQAGVYAEERGIRNVGFDEALACADLVCLTTGVAGVLPPEKVRKGQIILALTNPRPEIEPEDALSAGAAFAADGRSINNLLCYPGLFKGAISAHAKGITIEMKLAAARVIADHAAPDEILPDPLDRRTHAAVADIVEAVANGAF